jgi:hypothetical protein
MWFRLALAIGLLLAACDAGGEDQAGPTGKGWALDMTFVNTDNGKAVPNLWVLAADSGLGERAGDNGHIRFSGITEEAVAVEVGGGALVPCGKIARTSSSSYQQEAVFEVTLARSGVPTACKQAR